VPRADSAATLWCLSGPGSGAEARLPPGPGPPHLVSGPALMRCDRECKLMKLLAAQPGVTEDEVAAESGFASIVPPKGTWL
jgi:hypothetical protein